jgi:murein DD-endopeptidase MepM/ murein hydrolase activator NlpD
MSVLGDSARKLQSLRIALVVATLCLGLSTPATAAGKYKSIDRLKAGLQSVRSARAEAVSRLQQLKKEHGILLTKTEANAGDSLRFTDSVSVEVRELTSTVLLPTPPTVQILRERLNLQLSNGELITLAKVFLPKRTVITTADIQDAITRLKSIEAFRKLVGVKKAPDSPAQEFAKSTPNQERLQKIKEQIDFLQMKVAKCDQDEQHIRAEIQIVSSLSNHEDEQPSRIPILQRPTDTRQTSPFGMRMHPIANEERLHKGIDFSGPLGTRVNAAAMGKVTFAGPLGTFGNLVIIEHRPGFETAYAHLSQINVEVGDRIGAGYKIGEVGSTGQSTGPHLHFEVRINGIHVDPADYL